MTSLKRLPLQQITVAAILGLGVASLAVLTPAFESRLAARTASTPTPTAEPTAPPAAVLLPEEMDRALAGVMILANDHSFGTAFEVEPGVFLTAARLVSGGQGLRLVDNTGGSHAVRLVGVDTGTGLAEIRAQADGIPLKLGDSTSVRVGDSLVILASAKVVNLRAATPAVIASAGNGTFSIRADDLPGEVGGPLVGPGGTVVGVLTQHGVALPISTVAGEIAGWRTAAGTTVPLAALPADLVLRGTNDAAPAPRVSLLSITPGRVSASKTTLVGVHGTGFLNGPGLAVRFLPVASSQGGFAGTEVTAVSSSLITVKIPAGAVVQDYVVQVTNGDGATGVGATFTVTP